MMIIQSNFVSACSLKLCRHRHCHAYVHFLGVWYFILLVDEIRSVGRPLIEQMRIISYVAYLCSFFQIHKHTTEALKWQVIFMIFVVVATLYFSDGPYLINLCVCFFLCSLGLRLFLFLFLYFIYNIRILRVYQFRIVVVGFLCRMTSKKVRETKHKFVYFTSKCMEYTLRE